jgi:hypothetical protein
MFFYILHVMFLYFNRAMTNCYVKLTEKGTVFCCIMFGLA